MELNPNNPAIKRCLPMHHISAQIPSANEHYSLIERSVGHLIIRAPFANTPVANTPVANTHVENKTLHKAIQSVTGLKLPTKPLSSIENKEYILNWISPDEVLLLVPEKREFKVETQLRELMTGHFAIVNVTGGQTLLELSGKRAESILKKSSSYDIHPDNFPVGKVVTTIFAKSQAVLRRTGKESFQLIVRRSFSDYLWKWMVDAGSRD